MIVLLVKLSEKLGKSMNGGVKRGRRGSGGRVGGKAEK